MFVFEMMQPQLKPMDSDEIKQVDAIFKFAKALIPDEPSFDPKLNETCTNCRSNLTRTINLTAQEAIFIIYLASLMPERRMELVYSNTTAQASDFVREQLLTEAELVQFAIDASDDFSEENGTEI